MVPVSIDDDFEKLRAMHDRGALTDGEYEAARQDLTRRQAPTHAIQPPTSPQPYTTPGGDPAMAQAAGFEPQSDNIAIQKALMRLDNDWQYERQAYARRGRWGYLYYPSTRRGIATAILGTLFLALIAGMVFFGRGTGSAPSPWFFLIMWVILLAAGWDEFARGRVYEAAYRNYLERRQQIQIGATTGGFNLPSRGGGDDIASLF